jgi:hypothetical protein
MTWHPHVYEPLLVEWFIRCYEEGKGDATNVLAMFIAYTYFFV